LIDADIAAARDSADPTLKRWHAWSRSIRWLVCGC